MRTSPISRGFTLIELLVVISIIGFITTTAVTGLNIARRKSRDTKRLATASQIMKAMELCFLSNTGAYTETYANCCTAASAGQVRVSACGGNLITYLPGLTGVTDPSGNTTPCASGATSVCDISMSATVVNPASPPTTFTGYFFQEGGDAGGNFTPTGIVE